VLDNLEALLPRSLDPEAPPTLVAETAEQLAAILALARDLLPIGDTRLLLTSREPLDGIGPALFQRPENRREALGQAGAARPDAETEAMLQLVEAVRGHARTLALLAPSLRAQGVDATRRQLVALMEQMEREHPGDRERSLYASVALSLARLTPEHRERARVLGLFHGGVQLDMLRAMMAPEKQGWLRRLLRRKRRALGITWHAKDIQDLATQLINTGLATAGPYAHLALNPALCPYLRRTLAADQRTALEARWQQAMGAYVDFLVQQSKQDAELAATLTRLELPNLLALLAHREAAGDPAAVIDLTTDLHYLTQGFGRAQLHRRLVRARDAAEHSLAAQGGGLCHAAYQARHTRIKEQLATGQLQAAFDGAHALLDQARQAGPAAYLGADYDLAMAHWLLANVLKTAGNPEPALDLLAQARRGFETFARERPGLGAEHMASACLTGRGDCLRALGRLDEAAAAYEQGIGRDERLGAERDVAVGKGNLGTVRLQQGRIDEALAAYAEARARFEALGEPGSVAVIWHQTGMAEQQAGRGEAAEDAYRQALAIYVRLGDRAGQASTLGQLGNLYKDVLDRPEEAAAFYRQAVDRDVELGDRAKEGLVRNNLADTLRRLGRLDEARREVRRAIACGAEFGHAAEPWKTWDILAAIETAAADAPAAAAARAEAVGAYLAYRRAGGENHRPSGRLALALAEPLLAGDPAAAEALLDQKAAELDAADGESAQAAATLRPFLAPLRAICRGSRDPALADAPDLHYSMAAEIRLLLERLT